MAPSPARVRDPLLVFPTETVIQIFSFLPSHDVWRLRQLSKQYDKFLRDDEVELAALSRYESHDASDSAGTPPTKEGRIALMKAHHTGSPVAYVHIPPPSSDIHVDHCDANPVLKGKYLALRATLEDLAVLDLSTGEWRLCPTHDRIDKFTITASVLVWTTPFELCYQPVSQLGQAQHETIVHDDDGIAKSLAASGHMIAVLWEIDREEFELIVYDARSNQVQITWSLDYYVQSFSSSDIPMVLTSDSCYVISPLRYNDDDYDGSETSEAADTLEEDWQIAIIDRVDLTSGEGQRRTHSINARSACETCDDSSQIDVQPSGKEGEWHISVEFREGSCSHHHGLFNKTNFAEHTAVASPGAFWKGCYYYGRRISAKDEWSILAIDKLKEHAFIRQGLLISKFDGRVPRSSTILVNESFLVDFSLNSLRIFSVYTFDPAATSCKLDYLSSTEPGQRLSFVRDLQHKEGYDTEVVARVNTVPSTKRDDVFWEMYHNLSKSHNMQR